MVVSSPQPSSQLTSVSDVVREPFGPRIGRDVGEQCPIGSPEDDRDKADSRVCVLGECEDRFLLCLCLCARSYSCMHVVARVCAQTPPTSFLIGK